jgi:hypothetical protein
LVKSFCIPLRAAVLTFRLRVGEIVRADVTSWLPLD